MNLGKLLGAGKSFFGGGGKVNYREDKRFHLPKFNADHNPFSQKDAKEGENLNKVALPAAAKSQEIPTLSAPPAAKSVANWKEKLNPFRAPELKAAKPVQAVQTELSLETVKVVHNDLTDADIEVVPVKSRTNVQPEATVLPPAREAWEFMGERMVKSL